MKHLLYFLYFLSPPALLAATIIIAIGMKGDPMKPYLVAGGLILMVLAALLFPRNGHPMRRVVERIVAPSTYKAKETLTQFVVVNEAALEFQPTPQDGHKGWSRLDPIIDTPANPSSWLGGLPEMPQDVDWPETDGKAALFLAQIALSDLPNDIWGGIGPTSGWLLFFLAPKDWGGAQVIHIEERGTPRPYPNGASIENYLDSGHREAMQQIGQAAEDFRPPKIALAVSPAYDQPPRLFAHINEFDALLKRHSSLDISDPLWAPFAVGPNPTAHSIEMLARQTYLKDPGAVPAGIREVFEPTWKFEASVEAATMSGQVGSEFVYTATENPVRLLQLPSSLLLGWQFGDVRSLGVFMAPEDLNAGRWDKAWADYTD